MPEIPLIYSWNTLETCHIYLRHTICIPEILHEIYLIYIYTWEKSEIYQRYTHHIPEICRRFTLDMPNIYLWFPDVYLNYTWDVLDIYMLYFLDKPNIYYRYLKYVLDMPEIYYISAKQIPVIYQIFTRVSHSRGTDSTVIPPLWGAWTGFPPEEFFFH